MQKSSRQLFLFRNQNISALLFLILIIVIGIGIHTQLWDYDTQAAPEDIYFTWLDGKRILLGENPYERILSGNIRQNSKYATYFPLFYLLSSLSQLLGWREYTDWIDLWRHVFLAFNIGITGLVFYFFYQYRLLSLAIFAALFWLFNRWTLHVTEISHIDFMPIFFLVSSLMTFRKNQFTSLLLLSFSLALKQLAMILIPVYLIWICQSSETEKVKKIGIALILIFSVPLITSIPFIFLSLEGFIKSIFFSATRNPEGHFGIPSIDELIGYRISSFVGIKAKLPMLFLMGLIYLNVFRQRIGMYTSILVLMLVFINFNSVLFRQYLCWLMPFIPLCLSDYIKDQQPIIKAKEFT